MAICLLKLVCLRRPTFLFRQESRQRTGQRGKIPNLSPLWTPLIQTAKRGRPPFGNPRAALKVFANLSNPVVGGGVPDAPLFSELQPAAGTATHKLENPP